MNEARVFFYYLLAASVILTALGAMNVVIGFIFAVFAGWCLAIADRDASHRSDSDDHE